MPEPLKTYQKHRFTLIEIMVALGALMLMMSFLFQFVIGGQKLWTASEHMATTFDDAETVMTILGEDLRNLRYSNKVGFAKPFLTVENPTTLKYDSVAIPATVKWYDSEEKKVEDISVAKMWVFYTQFNDSGDSLAIGVYPVVYIYVGNTDSYVGSTDSETSTIRKIARTLFRVTLAKNGDGGIADISALQNICQLDFTADKSLQISSSLSLISSMATSLATMNLTENDILLSDVTDFDMEILAPQGVAESDFQNKLVGTDGMLVSTGGMTVKAAKSLPRGVQMKVALSPQNAINVTQWEETEFDSVVDNDELKKKCPEREELLQKNERAFTKTVSLDLN